jgi:LacI family transcriptional regulator
MVTSHDVARAAGVSQATVSRVLSGSAKVSPATRDRVLDALRQTGYTPNLVARAMRTRRTGTVGVVVASITNPFYPEVIEAISEELAANGSRMILWISEGSGDESALQAIRQGLVDGIVFTTVTDRSRPLHEALERQAPMVMLNRAVESVDADQVVSDNAAGGAAVADYFVAGGHTRVGLIAGPPSASTALHREAGFLHCMAEHGGKVPKARHRQGAFTHGGGYDAMRSLLEGRHPPTAVFCANDLSAFGAIDAARSLGARVPDDVWVTGFDDISMSSWAGYDLTTVRQPIREMCATAVKLLLARIDQPRRQTQRVTLRGELVVRGSTNGWVRPAG